MATPSWTEGFSPVAGYVVLRCLGQGAFGEVWEATSAGGIPTALKRIDLKGNARCGEAELRAMELLKCVRHPHLLSIHGFWIVDSTLVIACELADESLAQLMQRVFAESRDVIPVRQILHHLTDAAEALDYLGRPIHTLNNRAVRIQHCDVKPANLLLQGGAVKVADFGLAKSLQGIIENRSFSGTPAYSPPEFFQGKVASASDQYSLAVTYCQLRTGRLPFEGSFSEIVAGHLHGSPNLDGLTEKEQQIVVRALAKDPALRWDNCTKFIGELQRGMTSDSPAPSALRSGITEKAKTGTNTNDSTVVFRGQPITCGMLLIGEELIPVPLKKTQLRVFVVGAAAEVKVTQVFVNSGDRTIEATYVFPLPEDAAVNRMRMIVDDRIIESEVREKQEARQVYEQARQAGHGAALVEQTSPNIFTSSIANILPGQEIRVEITYLQALPFDDGMYRLVVPMVVSPRYVPGSDPAAKAFPGKVPEAILAPRLPAGFLRGDFVQIEADLDAGVPLCGFDSPSHDIETVSEEGTNRVSVRLRESDEIPNRDFVLNYRVRGPRIEHALVYEPEHEGEPGTFLLLTTPPSIPPERFRPRRVAFLLDCSGSMAGAPLQQAKTAALHMLDHLKPDDAFNIIAFGSNVRPLSASMLTATLDEVRRARAFIEPLGDLGGTELLEPLRMALLQVVSPQAPPTPGPANFLLDSLLKPFRRRSHGETQDLPDQLVIFLTDGSVSREREILNAVRPEIGQTRIVAFGIGVAVNRHLINKLTAASRGVAEFLVPGENITDRVDRVLHRLRHPVMTDIELKFDKDRIFDIIPETIPDLYCELPLQLTGRFRGTLPPMILLNGRTNDGDYAQEIIPEQVGRKAVGLPLSALWARRKIETMMDQLWEHPDQSEVLRRQITDLAIRYRLTSEYTSFVAVEHRTPTHPDQAADAVRVEVPQLMPQGMGQVDASPPGFVGYSAGNPPSQNLGQVSIQHRLDRVRRPRVHIQYDSETGGATVKKELPFVVGVLGDFYGSPPSPWQPLSSRTFISIDRDNFDDVMAALPVSLHLQVPDKLNTNSPEIDLQLMFRSMQDFEPSGIMAQVEPMQGLLRLHAVLLALLFRCQANSSELSESNEALREEYTELLLQDLASDTSLLQALNKAIADVNARLSAQLSEILHHPAFQKLEGSWRGLHYLVMNSETGRQLKLRVLFVTKNDLIKDIENAIEFDQSIFFKKLHDDIFGSSGGEPFGVLIGDFEFTNHPAEIEMLQSMSDACAAAHCPLISAASPEFFGLQTWADLEKPRDLAKLLMGDQHVKWHSFRDSENSQFVALTLPRVLARLPYEAGNETIKAFRYKEFNADEAMEIQPVSPNSYCWMNAAYAYAANMTRAFVKHNWCTEIRGTEKGGAVENLPACAMPTEDGEPVWTTSTEIILSGRKESELCALGFLPLCHIKDPGVSVFFSAQTCQRPKKYETPEATANAAIAARLPFVMATSRIAHYLKCMSRDKTESFMSRQESENWLNSWISEFVLAEPGASEDMKSRYPLAAAKITVGPIPGSPGRFRAVAILRPHLPLDQLTTSLKVLVNLPTMTVLD